MGDRVNRRRVSDLRLHRIGALLLLPLAAAGAGAHQDGRDAGIERHNDMVLRYKGMEQDAILRGAQLFHDFHFTDHRSAAGIRFTHRIVDDAGKRYKAVHYDHGNGLSVADVDGDGLLDLYFLTQMGPNALYRNLGGGKFEDITESAGVAVADRISVAAAFGDIDNDGDADLFVTTVRMGNLLFENDGKGRFKDISAAAGVDHTGHSSGALFFDYDRDGLLDLFVTNVGVYTTSERGRGGYYVGLDDTDPSLGAFAGHLHAERTENSILYRNSGKNRFEDVTRAAGIEDGSWSGDAAALDANGDGWLDIYLLNMQGHDQYFENVEGKRFERKSRLVFPRTSWGSMGIKVFDADNDGRLDIYITDMHSDMSKTIAPDKERRKSEMVWPESFLHSGGNSIFGNSFFRSLGNGVYEEASDRFGLEQYWPWGLSAGDVNADGWQDIFVTACMNYPFRYGANSLYLNNGGNGFLDLAFALGVEPREGGRMMTDWFEVDCDGADKGHKECQGHAGKRMVRGTLGSRSSAILDLDGDGDLDIVTNDFNSPPQVLISDLAGKHEIHYLQVALRGRKSNRDGLGAVVRVSAGDRTYVQAHDGASGYLSHSLMPLYFGLGDARTASKVEVLWPSGTKQTVTEGIPANGVLEVVEK